jgi:TPR repeat protein
MLKVLVPRHQTSRVGKIVLHHRRPGDVCTTALRTWRPLAEQGYAPAQYGLGLMYDRGQDVPQDYVTAHMRFNLAAAQLQSQFSLGADDRRFVAGERDRVAAKMTSEQVAEACQCAHYALMLKGSDCRRGMMDARLWVPACP